MDLKEAAVALAALAQETRLAIFRLLIEVGPDGVPAGQLAEALEVPPATLSFHLKELAHAGLAHARPQGRFVFYSADFERMAGLMTFLTRNCCKGMPHECLTTVETALSRCAPPLRAGAVAKSTGTCGAPTFKRPVTRSRS
jgi:DNA-binding transcriptional ArsR family regulator